jgi:hypothetical protein
MYITPHLHVVKDSWNFLIMFNRFLKKKILTSQLLNCERFLSVDNQLTSSQSFLIIIPLYKNYLV